MHRSLTAVVSWLAVVGVCLSAQTPVSFPASRPAQIPGAISAAPSAVATAALIGVVLDETSNKPVAGAIVSITAVQGTPAPTGRNNSRVITGSDGRYLFSGLPQGLYSLGATKNGYLNANAGSSTGGNSMPIDLAEGQIRTDTTIEMSRPGAISGTILDEAGEPVIGVQVAVARRVRSRGRVTWQNTGSGGSTDDRGMFRAGNLAPGDYVVRTEQSNTSVPTSMMDAYQKAAETLRPGEPNPLLDEVVMIGGMGLMPGSPSARLENAQVKSLSRSTAISPDASGGTFVYPSLYYPAASTASTATIVTIRSGEDRTGIDMALRPVRAVSIGGTVSGPDGPLSFTGVTLTEPDTIEASFLGGVIGTTTDATGAFMFLGVPSGDYVLHVTKLPAVRSRVTSIVTNTVTRADGSTSVTASSSGPSRVGPLPPDPTLWAEVPVSAGEKDIAGLTVNLQSGARLSGRVEFSGTAPKLTPQQLSSVTLSVQPITGPARNSRAPRTRVDEQGQITSQGFPAGEYNIAVFSVPPAWTLQSITSKGIDVSQRPLEIGMSDISDLVVTFTDTTTELTGTVTAPDGSVPRAAAVFLFPSDEPLVHDYGINSRRVLGTRATANGRYTFNGFPAGDYRVIAIDDVAKLADVSGEFVQTLTPKSTSQRFGAGDKRQQNLTVVTIK
jgi:hypothetical protein